MASYTELLETAGLKVPFEEGSIKGIAQQMTDWLEDPSGIISGSSCHFDAKKHSTIFLVSTDKI